MCCLPQCVPESFKNPKKREFKSKHVAAHSDSRLYFLIKINVLRFILILYIFMSLTHKGMLHVNKMSLLLFSYLRITRYLES